MWQTLQTETRVDWFLGLSRPTWFGVLDKNEVNCPGLPWYLLHGTSSEEKDDTLTDPMSQDRHGSPSSEASFGGRAKHTRTHTQMGTDGGVYCTVQLPRLLWRLRRCRGRLKCEHFVLRSVPKQLLLLAAVRPQSPVTFCWLESTLFRP